MKAKQHLKHSDPDSLAQVAGSIQKFVSESKKGLDRGFRVFSRGHRLGLNRRKSGGGGGSSTRLLRTWRQGDEGVMNQAVTADGKVLMGVMETEETEEEVRKRLLFIPDGPLKLQWDIFLILLASFEAALVPFQLAFEDGVGVSGLSLAIDIFFITDIVCTFRCPYWTESRANMLTLVTVPNMIAQEYVTKNFFLDFLSSITLILPNIIALKALRLLRIIRVPQLSAKLRELSESRSNTKKTRSPSSLATFLSVLPRSVWEFFNVCLTIYFW